MEVIYLELKTVIGDVAIRGARPFLSWGLTLVLVTLGFAFVYRFARGEITASDLAVLLPIAAPLMQQLYQRHVEVKLDPARSLTGLANPHGGAMATP